MNKLSHNHGCQFKVMFVVGPNVRTDYHVNEGEEWFWMLEGDMTLKVVDGGVFRDIEIREGEAFLLPPNVPHSPQRRPDAIGLVLERERRPGELDRLRWYCQKCKNMLTEYSFFCTDLGTQLPPVIRDYYSAESFARRTCQHCGTVDQPPAQPAQGQ